MIQEILHGMKKRELIRMESRSLVPNSEGESQFTPEDRLAAGNYNFDPYLEHILSQLRSAEKRPKLWRIYMH
jgi:hypothetical protein